MSQKIASFYAEFSADTTKLQNGMKTAQSGMASLKSAAAAVGIAIGAITTVAYTAGRVIDATAGEFVRYAASVKAVKDITQDTAEATSRMIQVTDDYKLTTQDLMMAQRQLATQNKTLSIDTLAAMSDEYLKLNTASERQLFLSEQFGGRVGQRFAEMMAQGSAAIQARAGAISDALILDEAAIKAARDYEYALDDLEDAAYGVKVSMGKYILPALNDFLEYTNDAIAGWGEFIEYLNLTSSNTTNLKVLEDRMSAVREEMEKYAAAGDLGALQYANAEAELAALTAQYRDAQSVLSDVTETTEDLAEETAALNQELINSKTAWQLSYSGAETAADRTKIATDYIGEQLMGLSDQGALVWNGFLAATGQISEEAIAQFIKIQFALENLQRMIASGKYTIDFLINVAVQQVGAATGTTTSTSNATHSAAKPYTGGDPSQGRAAGGPIFPGQSYAVGEQGEEGLLWTGGGWTVVPAQKWSRMKRHASGGMAGGGVISSQSGGVVMDDDAYWVDQRVEGNTAQALQDALYYGYNATGVVGGNTYTVTNGTMYMANGQPMPGFPTNAAPPSNRSTIPIPGQSAAESAAVDSAISAVDAAVGVVAASSATAAASTSAVAKAAETISQSGTANVQATQQQTAITTQKNNEMIAEMRAVRLEISRILTVIPKAIQDSYQKVVGQ